MTPVRHITPPDWMANTRTQKIMGALNVPGAAPLALFVGGAVRNTLMGFPVGDIDIATIHTPAQVTEILSRAGVKVIPTGIDHGTVTAVTDGAAFEITTLRRDVDTDGRHANVAFTDNWVEDAARRDFTMNALYAAPDGAIYDPTGQGLADLEQRRVKFVGDPAARIAEDYLRILRFFRFHAYYGAGDMDVGALSACRASADKIATLSRERITHEFLKILSAENPAPVLSVMFENGVLSEIIASENFNGCQNPEMNVISKLFILSGMKDKDFSKWLILSNTQKKYMADLSLASQELKTLSEKTIRRLVHLFGNDVAYQTALIKGADIKLSALAKNVNVPVLPVNGDDLITAGIPAGPELGRQLKSIEDWWIAQDFMPDRTACLEKISSG